MTSLPNKSLESKPNVEFRLYRSCNHLFMEGEGRCTPAEYSKPGHVAETVIADIAGWVGGHK